jgi:23S rRNA pseudouridine1911/1915/1917 synthase
VSNSQTVVVLATQAGQRLDRFLAEARPDLSRARLQTLIKEGHITLNEKNCKPRDEVKAGDQIQLTIPADKPAEAQPQDLPLTLLYEDDDLAVLNKESGMVVHPSAGHEDGTVVNALLHRYGPLSSIGGVQRPGIVHRLDKETSGCLVIARNDAAHQALSAQFASRETKKIYLAVVQEIPAIKQGRIENFLGRNPANRLQMAVVPEKNGKNAITDYEVRHIAEGQSLLLCHIHTGRTHQIRVHCKHLGHPILGDEIYARVPRQTVRVPRLMLHAWRLSFTHPRSGERLDFTAPVPPEFRPFLPPDFPVG